MTIVQASRSAGEIWYDDARFLTDKRPWFGQLPELATGDFSFAVLGDRCGMATAGVFEKALEVVKDLKPDFVVSVGDLIEGYWRDANDAIAEWEDIDAKIGATGLPFFHVVGNHDYGNNVMLNVWRERKGFEYYAFRAGDALFLVLNTEDPPSELSDEFIDMIKKATYNVQNDPENSDAHMQAFYDDIVSRMSPEQLKELGRIDLAFGDEQMAFAERVLEENRDAKWTFISMHKPGWKSEDKRYAKLIELLDGRPHTIFAGHLHAMEYSVSGSGERIQLGRTGGHAHGNGPESDNLFLWVNVRNGKPSYRVIHLNGIQEIGSYEPKAHAEEAKS
ncbi:metallophosphoesterase family protein [Paenibacillus arenilitoris]|uniref:Metallophosphoesterase n=1 Tax=Paenibacillus arenilitoris TaxID=2772299 RepID=A0A927CM25_9BACL|nr:metallophosphoesterase [Paenibacillus arenilitoris]MBD2869078.1 metallophosphoesterase [Paenibacillus arenilitoris]